MVVRAAMVTEEAMAKGSMAVERAEAAPEAAATAAAAKEEVAPAAAGLAAAAQVGSAAVAA